MSKALPSPNRLTRRLMLLAGVALPSAAVAQRRPAHPGAPAAAGKHGKSVDPAAGSTPADTPVGPLDTAAKWAIVVDYNTGATLLSKEADVPMPPSSMTKLMTAYIVYGMLKSGRLKLDQTLPVSEKAWRMGGSKMFVTLGAQLRVEDLIRGMIVQSGNDACIVLAEGIAGSEEAFVELMNHKARELGLTNSVLPEHHRLARPGTPHVSVRDIAHAGRADHPGFSGIL